MRELTAMQLLFKSMDPKTLAAADELILDGYILLRSATTGLDEGMAVRYKSQASLLDAYKGKVWEVRKDLLKCMEHMGRARRGDESEVAPAKEFLKRAVSRLKVLVAVMYQW